MGMLLKNEDSMRLNVSEGSSSGILYAEVSEPLNRLRRSIHRMHGIHLDNFEKMDFPIKGGH